MAFTGILFGMLAGVVFTFLGVWHLDFGFWQALATYSGTGTLCAALAIAGFVLTDTSKSADIEKDQFKSTA